MQSPQPSPDSKSSRQVMISASMQLEKARQVEWTMLYGPNKGLRRPLCELMDKHIADLGNLGWIISNWRDPEIKAAALTLLAHELGEPQTQETIKRFGAESVGGDKYLKEQERENHTQGTFILAVGLTLGFMLIFEFIWRAGQMILAGQSWLSVILALVIVLLILLPPFVLSMRYQIRKAFTTADNYRLGREGEEWLTDKIRARLDNRWTAFRNLHIPGHKEDLDLVVVGPCGVRLLEVKAFRQELRLRGTNWERLDGRQWKPLGQDPIAQARANAAELSHYLDRHGIKLFVQPAVVLTQPQPGSHFDPAIDLIWKQFEVDAKLAEMNAAPGPLAIADQARVVATLKDLTQSNQTK
ncbi:MAG: nuclease-related domain-containing protein [Anaerolineae bacterium]